jgi:cation transport ATPase
MGLMGRMRVVTASVISIGFVAILYEEIAKQLIQRAANQNGPFSQLAGQVETIVPLVLVLLLLVMLLWLVVGGVQKEKSVRRRPR